MLEDQSFTPVRHNFFKSVSNVLNVSTFIFRDELQPTLDLFDTCFQVTFADLSTTPRQTNAIQV